MRKLLTILLCAAALSTLAGTNDFFPVMAWNGVPPDLAVIKKMKECGLTVAGFVTPATLKLCRKAGLKGIVSDRRVSGYDWTKVDPQLARSNVLSLIKEVGRNPAVYGYYLRDEPTAGYFPGLETVASIIREKAPGAWPYINLFPNYANADQLGEPDYAAYLRQFCAICHPTTLSYDFYALMDDGSLRDGYWQNLEQVRAAAVSNSLPFWAIVLAEAHFSYREPSAADFRFEVYSALAYGARGIAYFQYFAPNVGNYRMAAIDQFGHPTATWNYLQNVNLQIAALAPTLLQLTSDDVYHFGSVPGGSHGRTNSDLVTSVDGNNFVVGDFTHHDGSRYVLVVNKSVRNSAVCYPHFAKPVKHLRFVSPYTGHLDDYSGEQCWLAPGQGVLLKPE